MTTSPAVALTQALIRQNTINPPGNEAQCAALVAKRLEELMNRLGSQKADIERRLADPALYEDASSLKTLLEDQAYVVRELALVEAEWLEKQAELERS